MRISLLGKWIPLLRTMENAENSVALSIDDGPTQETTPHLLALMKEFNARATFFLSGIRAVRHPEIVRQLVAEGHEVFAHGWDHVRLFTKGGGALVDQFSINAMKACEDLLSQFRPTPHPYLIRLPYGYSHRNARAHSALSRWQPGCQIADWALSFEDHTIAPRCRDLNDVRRECKLAAERTLAAENLVGAILLCHDHPFDIDGPYKTEVTPILMEAILSQLQQRGLNAVPIKPHAQIRLTSRFVLN